MRIKVTTNHLIRGRAIWRGGNDRFPSFPWDGTHGGFVVTLVIRSDEELRWRNSAPWDGAAPHGPGAQHDLGIDARGVGGGFVPNQNRVTK